MITPARARGCTTFTSRTLTRAPPQVASLPDMAPGTISAYGGQVASNVVQVQTADTSGNSADRTFQLILSC